MHAPSSITGLAATAASFLFAAGTLGCNGGQATDALSGTAPSLSRSALVVTNCSGPAISAAVAAGGEVVLDCGPNPITVTVPNTTVTRPTRLRPVVPLSVTLTHLGFLFSVRDGASFQVENLRFVAGSASAMAIHNTSGSATVVGSTFRGYSGFAISVHAGSRATVVRSSFDFNGSSSGFFAGPIYNEGSIVEVRDCAFSFNVSGGNGGAITSVGGGSVTVSGSTFASNSAGSGGAIYLSGGSHSVTNSTFRTNQANAAGGAILAVNSTSFIRNSTFSDNRSPQGTLAGSAEVWNSIIFDQVSPSSPCQLGGSGNIQWPATRPLCGPGFTFADPLLGPLANNGGPTQTMALGVGSAAIDRAMAAACPGTDQRGVPRPRDGDFNGVSTCDIGSFER